MLRREAPQHSSGFCFCLKKQTENGGAKRRHSYPWLKLYQILTSIAIAQKTMQDFND
ncbi:hypothetical protein FEV09_18205 [Pseudanabaena catenata USMAC16]|uniref:Uncharacterized protein n=1 Tax=Pseudanabaena catenata USMAC16 TaxID=1855837 RepID=A0A9X4M9P5_9CYAN|nr:hypothetical protein [Pseudanabaena catenata]MDG3496476.1 hypothetical protein [Pseudanabaena catenata USMAC16]